MFVSICVCVCVCVIYVLFNFGLNLFFSFIWSSVKSLIWYMDIILKYFDYICVGVSIHLIFYFLLFYHCSWEVIFL